MSCRLRLSHPHSVHPVHLVPPLFFELVQRFGTSGRYLCFRKKKHAMSEIIISVGLYAAALAFLLKGASVYCNHSAE